MGTISNLAGELSYEKGQTTTGSEWLLTGGVRIEEAVTLGLAMMGAVAGDGLSYT